MGINICFIEDQQSSWFYPLILTRPLALVQCAGMDIESYWKCAIPIENIGYFINDYRSLVYAYPSQVSQDWILLNSRYLPTAPLIEKIISLSPGNTITHYNDLIAYRPKLQQTPAQAYNNAYTQINQTSSLASLDNKHIKKIDYIWDTIDIFSQMLPDHPHLTKKKNYLSCDPQKGIISYGKFQVYHLDHINIEPNTTFITTEGNIFLGNNVTIEAGSILRGPLFIGDKTTIKSGANIGKNTSIGSHCKIGGEVHSSIFYPYSNKGHSGFVGHSIIGSWCNLGADTNTSNLKNTYAPIKIKRYPTDKLYNTKRIFLGTIMGDHSKTAINTQLNTGTFCGISSNIACAGFPDRGIPSFRTILCHHEHIHFPFHKAKPMIETMMKRRNIIPSEHYLGMLKKIDHI